MTVTMPFTALAFFDGFASIFSTPFIVPVFGTLMILGIVVAGIWSGVRTREMQSQERLAMIAKGLTPEPVWDEAMLRNATQHAAAPTSRPFTRPGDGAGARRAGIVLSSIGAGLILFFAALATILQNRAVLCGAATGLIPLAIGIGFLVDARLRKAEYARIAEAARMSDPASAPAAPHVAPLH